MTGRHIWKTTDIIKTFYGLATIEQAFKNIKNPFHLSVNPQYHWTDQKIKVHYFICVLGYLLATIIWQQARAKTGFNGTLNNLLEKLNNIRLVTLLKETKKKGKIKAVYQLEEMDEEEKLIMKELQLEDFHINKPKFKGVSVYNFEAT